MHSFFSEIWLHISWLNLDLNFCLRLNFCEVSGIAVWLFCEAILEGDVASNPPLHFSQLPYLYGCFIEIYWPGAEFWGAASLLGALGVLVWTLVAAMKDVHQKREREGVYVAYVSQIRSLRRAKLFWSPLFGSFHSWKPKVTSVFSVSWICLCNSSALHPSDRHLGCPSKC